MAVTDQPASLGTQELYFSNCTHKAAYYAASVDLGALSEEKQQGELAKLATMRASAFKALRCRRTVGVLIEKHPHREQTPNG